MNHQHELFKKIQIYGFILGDTALYLDTHPMDQAALNYYSKYRELNKKAIAEYTASYGPITMDDVESTNQWAWIDKPWPWEMEA